MPFFAAWGGGDLEKAFLVVGVVFLVDGVELFNLVFLEDVPHYLLALDNEVYVFVLVFRLLCEFLAVGDAVCDFQQFLGDFGDGEALALIDLSTLIVMYFSALLVESASSYSYILILSSILCSFSFISFYNFL